MKIIFCMQAMLCLYLNGLAQPLPNRKEGLTIGDIMPDIVLNKIYNYPIRSVGFSDFQKELTIIDFWATWCGSCVGSFPKMHALQQKFNGRLQVLMVNGSPDDHAKKVERFLEKRTARTGKTFTLPYILNDKTFSDLFPHQSLPHCVWINKNGKILAITDSEAITESNIEAVLSNKAVAFEYKDDALLYDEAKADLPGGTDNIKEGLLYRSFITVEQKHKGTSVSYEASHGDNIKLMRILNYSLLPLYQKGFRNVFKHGINRLQVDDNIAAVFQMDIDPKLRNRFCYEVEVSSASRSEVMEWLAKDLQRCFNITAVAEQKEMSCYILSAGKGIAGLKSKGGKPSSDLGEESLRKYISNGNMEELVTLLEMILKKPVVNETGFTQHVDMTMPADIFSYTPGQVTSFLESQGIRMRAAPMLLWVPRLKAIE